MSRPGEERRGRERHDTERRGVARHGRQGTERRDKVRPATEVTVRTGQACRSTVGKNVPSVTAAHRSPKAGDEVQFLGGVFRENLLQGKNDVRDRIRDIRNPRDSGN